MQRKEHWERVYSTKRPDEVSWYQAHAERSLRLIEETGVPLNAAIIDVGGGASTVVDDLVGKQYTGITVLDISATALAAARHRLGPLAVRVRWVESDITEAQLPPHTYDLWHDRAVFHFLTSTDDRRAYVETLLHAVKPEGHVIIATFAEDGPAKCGGLPVQRYGADELHAALGPRFALVRREREEHRTPAGVAQQFGYAWYRVIRGCSS